MRTASRPAAALVAALVLLVGCGSDDTTTTSTGQGEEKTSQPTPSESVPPGPIQYTAIALVSASNAEGEVAPQAVVLDSPKAVDDFAGQFSGSQMPQELHKQYAQADLPKDEVMMGAVVDVSCQAPTEVQVEKTRSGVEITASGKPAKGKEVQCLVPVTTVALISVPEAAV